MSVGRINELERHSGGAADGIKISARRAKSAFAAKGNNFKIAAMLTAIKSKTVFIITAVKHFMNIFKNGIANGNTAVSNCIKMVIKNLLKYIHSKIISQKQKKCTPPLKIEGQGC